MPAKYFVTVADSMTQAATVFTALTTGPDGSTVNGVRVPQGVTKISTVGAAVSHDVISVIDTGNNFTLQLSGVGMIDGTQELAVGCLATQETGTSVTGNITYLPAFYRNVDIKVKGGEIINAAAAYDGTDPGSPFIAVTLGFE